MITLTLPVYSPKQANNLFASTATLPISKAFTKLKTLEPTTPKNLSQERSVPFEDTLEAKLYNNAADLKIDYGTFATHLSSEWRSSIFSQLDNLLSFDAWNEESAFLGKASFTTFLRFLTFARPTRMPTLGVDHQGNLIAAWINQPLKVFVTFLANDYANATMISKTERGDEQLNACSGPVYALRATIEQNGNRSCLDA